MNIEEEIFARKRPLKDKATAFGFTKNDEGGLFYTESIMDGDLTVSITLSPAGSTLCRVFDSESCDDYAPLNIEAYTGSYVGSVREEYKALLEKIADNCFDDVPFASDQANRIAARIADEFDAYPEHPFKKDNGAVFRHARSGKWFALEMYVKENSLDDYDGADPDRYIELLNVKIVPDTLESLLKEPGIHRCYHMNKKMWVTLTMNDTLTDDRIMELVRRSFELTGGSSSSARKRVPGEKAYWIIPSNPANYDVMKGFRESGNDTISWHHRIDVQPGDIVYIYQTEPIGAVMYRCEAVRTHLPRPVEWRGWAPSAKYRMDIHLTDVFDKSQFPRSWMNEHGIKKTIRSQRSAPPEFAQAIEKSRG